jgi:putative ABC transport system permease protein
MFLMMRFRAPTLWRYTAGEMRRRPGRTLLTLLGIVLGVAAVVAILLTTAATHRAYGDLFEALAGKAALEVVAEGMSGFDPAIRSKLETIPGVQAAVPVVQTATVLLGKGAGASALAFGVDPAIDQAARRYALRAGRFLDNSDGVLLEANFARAQGLELGQKARFLTPVWGLTGPVIAELPIMGLLEPQGAAIFNGGAVTFMPLATAQRLFDLRGRLNAVQLILAAGAAGQEVEAAVRGQLPPGLIVQRPALRGDLAQDNLLATELALSSLSVVSLVAGAFVILNSFLMNLGERRQQLAILRALGTTRAQVTRLLLREALLLGMVGTVLGIGLGLLLSAGQQQMMQQLLGVTLPAEPWPALPFVGALLLGPGMAVAATYWPARRAGRRAPLEDLLQKAVTHRERSTRWPAYVGLGLLGLFLLVVIGLLAGWVRPQFIPVVLPMTVAASMAGGVLSLPLLLRPLMRLAGTVLLPLLGMEGRLAFRQLQRRPTRTALTAGILLIGVVVSVAFGQSMRNSVRDIYQWCDNNVGFDFIIRGIMPDTTLLITAVPLPEKLAEELAGVDGVQQVGKVSFLQARAQGRPIVVLPFTIVEGQRLPFALASGDRHEAPRRLLQGEVVLGTALAHRCHLGVGDAIQVETRQGPLSLRIAGTTPEYTVGGMVLYAEWQQCKTWFAMNGVHAFTVMVRPGAAADVATRLQSFCDAHGLRLQSKADFRGVLDQSIQSVQGFFWGLVLLVFVVASLGVVNTLTMNVLEQTRELGILRAVALTRGQLSRMIVAQAVTLAFISLLPGTLLGIFMAYLMNRSAVPILGQEVQFYLDEWFLASCCLAGLVIAVLAAFFPARRAARLNIVRALQYE